MKIIGGATVNCETISKSRTWMEYGVQKKSRNKRQKKISEEIMAQICPHLTRSLNPICLESQQTKAGLA